MSQTRENQVATQLIPYYESFFEAESTDDSQPLAVGYLSYETLAPNVPRGGNGAAAPVLGKRPEQEALSTGGEKQPKVGGNNNNIVLPGGGNYPPPPSRSLPPTPPRRQTVSSISTSTVNIPTNAPVANPPILAPTPTVIIQSDTTAIDAASRQWGEQLTSLQTNFKKTQEDFDREHRGMMGTVVQSQQGLEQKVNLLQKEQLVSYEKLAATVLSQNQAIQQLSQQLLQLKNIPPQTVVVPTGPTVQDVEMIQANIEKGVNQKIAELESKLNANNKPPSSAAPSTLAMEKEIASLKAQITKLEEKPIAATDEAARQYLVKLHEEHEKLLAAYNMSMQVASAKVAALETATTQSPEDIDLQIRTDKLRLDKDETLKNTIETLEAEIKILKMEGKARPEHAETKARIVELQDTVKKIQAERTASEEAYKKERAASEEAIKKEHAASLEAIKKGYAEEMAQLKEQLNAVKEDIAKKNVVEEPVTTTMEAEPIVDINQLVQTRVNQEMDTRMAAFRANFDQVVSSNKIIADELAKRNQENDELRKEVTKLRDVTAESFSKVENFVEKKVNEGIQKATPPEPMRVAPPPQPAIVSPPPQPAIVSPPPQPAIVTPPPQPAIVTPPPQSYVPPPESVIPEAKMEEQKRVREKTKTIEEKGIETIDPNKLIAEADSLAIKGRLVKPSTKSKRTKFETQEAPTRQPVETTTTSVAEPGTVASQDIREFVSGLTSAQISETLPTLPPAPEIPSTPAPKKEPFKDITFINSDIREYLKKNPTKKEALKQVSQTIKQDIETAPRNQDKHIKAPVKVYKEEIGKLKTADPEMGLLLEGLLNDLRKESTSSKKDEARMRNLLAGISAIINA